MSGVRFTLRLDDLAAQAGFERIISGADDLTDLMENIGAALLSSAKERIARSNLSPDGVPWPRSLRAQIEGGPTLHDDGYLLDSLAVRAGPREVVIGSNLPYAGIHQTGGRLRPKTSGALSFTLANGTSVTVGEVAIPARPYLGVSDEDKDEIEGLTIDFFNRLLT